MSYFAPYIDDTGLHMPTYEDRLQDLLSAYRSIFGPDAELSPAVPDYQLLSVLAKALDDTSALVLKAYNARNPFYASGQALDLLAPQYGLTRAAEETDASLRNRIAASLSGRGIALRESLSSALAAVPYIRAFRIYENDTDAADARGIPAHSLAVVTYGGNQDTIARAIFNKKSPGIGTYGTTSVQITDELGNAHTVRFTKAGSLAVYPSVFIKGLEGFSLDSISAPVKTAIQNHIGALSIGEALNIPQLYGLIYNAVPEQAASFVVQDIQITTPGGTAPVREVVSPAWNQRISVTAAAIQFIVS